MTNKPPLRQRPRRRRTPDQTNAKLQIKYDGEAKIAQALSPQKIVLYQSLAKVACLALIPITLMIMPERSAEILKVFGLFAGMGGVSGLKKRFFGN